MNRILIAFLIPVMIALHATAQSLSYKSLPNPVLYDTTSHKEPGAFKSLLPRLWILPVGFIAYGVTALNNGELKEINQKVKWELSQEHQHKPFHLDNYLQWSPAVAVYALNAFNVKGKHNLADRSIIYGISTLIMAGTVFATKDLTHQLRPDGSNYASFPSGHTATAFAAAEFMRKEYQDVSIWYGVAGYAAAAATGYLRMYNNKHWLSDVVAGAGVGILSTDLAYLLYPTVKKVMGSKVSGSTMGMPYYQNGQSDLVSYIVFK